MQLQNSHLTNDVPQRDVTSLNIPKIVYATHTHTHTPVFGYMKISYHVPPSTTWVSCFMVWGLSLISLTDECWWFSADSAPIGLRIVGWRSWDWLSLSTETIDCEVSGGSVLDPNSKYLWELELMFHYIILCCIITSKLNWLNLDLRNQPIVGQDNFSLFEVFSI